MRVVQLSAAAVIFLVVLLGINAEASAPRQTPPAASYARLLQEARLLSDGKDHAGAVRVSQKAIALDASRWEAYIVAATAYSAQGLFEDALGTLQLALVRAPEDRKPGIRDALSKIRERLANPEAALNSSAAVVSRYNQWIRSIGAMKFTHVDKNSAFTGDYAYVHTYSEMSGDCSGGFGFSLQVKVDFKLLPYDASAQPTLSVITYRQRFRLAAAAPGFAVQATESNAKNGSLAAGRGFLPWAVTASPVVLLNEDFRVDGKSETDPLLPPRVEYSSPSEVLVLRDETDARELAKLLNQLHAVCTAGGQQ